MLVLIITVVHAFQLIPVRGRKLENLLQELTEAFDFNLSP